MKIIGHVPGGYLVQISKVELRSICGLDEGNTWNDSVHNHDVNKWIDIDLAWKKLSPIINSADAMKRNAETLRGLAAVLDGTAALVDRATALTPPVEPPPPTV